MTDDLSRLKRLAEEMKLPGITSLIARVEKAEARVEVLEKMDREAATHVESVICMMSDRFTGNPPYVGWKGLGQALREDYEELKSLRARAALGDTND